jgi:chorismate mutase
MWCRGIRGATVAEANTRDDILSATQELLRKMLAANYVDKQSVTCMFFSTTPDLNAEFPALAARQMGWTDTALMCSQEIAVPGSLERCIRIMVLVNTEKRAEDIRHVYIRGAETLRDYPEDRGKQT